MIENQMKVYLHSKQQKVNKDGCEGKVFQHQNESVFTQWRPKSLPFLDKPKHAIQAVWQIKCKWHTDIFPLE